MFPSVLLVPCLVFSFLFFLFDYGSCGVTTCADAYGCDGETLDDDKINCNGYSACEDATLTCTDSYSACQCSGYLGCYSASVTSTGNTYCRGYYGCKDATVESTDLGIWCTGDYACDSATLSAPSAPVSCYGNFGCYNSAISGSNIVAGFGYKSSYQATVSSSGISSNSLLVSLFGIYSGEELDIVCESGDTCNVACESNDACIGVDMYCYGDCNFDCNNDGDDNCYYVCPTVYDYSSLDISDETKAEWDKFREEKTQLKKELQIEFDNIVKEKGYYFNNIKDLDKIKELKYEFYSNEREKFNQLRIKYNREPIKHTTLEMRHSYMYNNNNNRMENLKLTREKIDENLNNRKSAVISIGILSGISLLLNVYLKYFANTKSV